VKVKRSLKYIYVLIIFSLLTQSAFAENKFLNNLKEIKFERNPVGKPEIILNLNKKENVRVLKKDDLEYVILMPETSNSLRGIPVFDNVSDVVSSVEVKTQPYSGNIKGYTKIVIKTKKPISMNAKSVVADSIQKAESKPITKTVQKSKKVEPKVAVKPVKKEQAKQIVETKPVQEKQLATTPKVAETKPVQEKQLAATPKVAETKPVQEKQLATTPKVAETKPVKEKQLATIPKVAETKPVQEKQVATKSKVVETKPVQEKQVATKSKVVETKPVQEKQVETTQKVAETTMETPVDIIPDNINKTNEQKIVTKDSANSSSLVQKGFLVSFGITGLLLLMLLLLKKHNRKYPKIAPNKQRKQDIENVENVENIEDIESYNNDIDEVENVAIVEDMSENKTIQTFDEIVLPIHSECVHQNIQESNVTVSDEENFVNNVEEDIVQPESFTNIGEEIIDDNIIENTENVLEKESNIEQEFDKTIDVEDFEVEYNESLSPDDVFGVFEEEIQNNDSQEEVQDNTEHGMSESEVLAQNLEENINDLQEHILQTNYEEQNSLVKDNNDFVPKVENVVEENSITEKEFVDTEIINQMKSPAEVEMVETVQEPIQESIQENVDEISEEIPVEQDDEVIKDSFELTPTKSLYLVNYDGTSVLMAAIKDEYYTLKKFDEVIEKPMIVRQAEKNTKKTTYIVRLGSFRGVVEVTMKNVELVMEL
jgi:hypothetical protein